MITVTPDKLSNLPQGTLLARAPVTLDEAEKWAEELGADTVYWWPPNRMAFVRSEPEPQAWTPEEILRREG